MNSAQKIYAYGALTGTVICLSVYSLCGGLTTCIDTFKRLGK